MRRRPFLDLYITANSPGEIAGWATPVIRELRRRVDDARVTLVIVPCPYASGAEVSYGASVEGVDRCVKIGAIGAVIDDDERARRLTLHLGGDYFFSAYLSKRLRAPLWGYASKPRFRRFVERYFVPDERAAQNFRLHGCRDDRFERVGHLALDSVITRETEEETRAALSLAPDEPVIVCMTGSRPLEYSIGAPYFARILAQVLEKHPDHRVFFPLAPTVREDLLRSSLAEAGVMWRGTERVREIGLGDGRWGTVVRDRTLEVLNCAKLAVAVPGTNNLQAAALYVPFIMVLPLDRADEVPLEGILGVIPNWFPGFKALKRRYVMRKNERTKYLALPNRMAGKILAPEIRGIFEPEAVEKMILELLASPERLKAMRRAFWELTHERGGCAKIAVRIEEWIRQQRENGGGTSGY